MLHSRRRNRKNNGRSAGNGWNSRLNNALGGTDYVNRTGTANSDLYDSKPIEAKHIYRDFDSQAAAAYVTGLDIVVDGGMKVW